MQPKPLIKQIKRIPYFFLLLILFSATFKIAHDINSVGKTTFLDVRTFNLKEKTFKEVELGENSFTTGMEGVLRWKVKDLKEAFLVGLADRDRLISYYDILYLLLLDAGLFFMIYRMNEETIFSEQLSTGLKVVLYCIMFYPFATMIGNYYSNQFIQELTNNQFKGQYENFSISKFQILFYLMIFMYPFLQKAINLQKEQDLTI